MNKNTTPTHTPASLTITPDMLIRLANKRIITRKALMCGLRVWSAKHPNTPITIIREEETSC